jgi:hypothetical protein
LSNEREDFTWRWRSHQTVCAFCSLFDDKPVRKSPER